MTTLTWFETTIDDIVDGYVESIDSNKLNDEQLVDDICEELETIFNAKHMRQLVENRLNKIIKDKQMTILVAADVEHIHFTYTCMITDKLLFKEAKEDENGIYMYWFDELENDELKLCEEIVKHVEPDKVNEYNSVQITFNDNKWNLCVFVAHSMDQETCYGFIVKLIDEEKGIYDVEELVD